MSSKKNLGRLGKHLKPRSNYDILKKGGRHDDKRRKYGAPAKDSENKEIQDEIEYYYVDDDAARSRSVEDED